MTRHVEHLVRRKKEAYLRLRKRGSDRALEDRAIEGYKVARKELKNGLRRARRVYEKALAGRIKENPKAFYTYEEQEDDQIFTSERDLDVCEDSVKQDDILQQVDVRKEDVLELLKNMRRDGPDGIYP
eukprot:g14949.t1